MYEDDLQASEKKYRDEYEIVNRVWAALGVTGVQEVPIWVLVTELRQQRDSLRDEVRRLTWKLEKLHSWMRRDVPADVFGPLAEECRKNNHEPCYCGCHVSEAMAALAPATQAEPPKDWVETILGEMKENLREASRRSAEPTPKVRRFAVAKHGVIEVENEPGGLLDAAIHWVRKGIWHEIDADGNRIEACGKEHDNG